MRYDLTRAALAACTLALALGGAFYAFGQQGPPERAAELAYQGEDDELFGAGGDDLDDLFGDDAEAPFAEAEPAPAEIEPAPATPPIAGPPLTIWTNPDLEKIDALLERRVSFNYFDIPLSEAVRDLVEQTDVPMVIDATALDDMGLGTDVPVVRELKGVTLRSALNHILSEYDLTWTYRDEALVITSLQEGENELLTRFYIVSDLLGPPPQELQARIASGDSRTLTGFESDYDSLIDLITSTVAHPTWDEVGGPGSIMEMDNCQSLVVNQTQDVHAQIEQLLNTMRQARESAVQLDPQASTPLAEDTLVIRVYTLPYLLTHYGAPLTWSGDKPPTAEQRRVNAHQQAVAVGEAITGTIAPRSWQAEGGSGALRVASGTLIVRQTPAVHAEISQLLRVLDSPARGTYFFGSGGGGIRSFIGG